jgi:REP element-mobilizing transposase RayT
MSRSIKAEPIFGHNKLKRNFLNLIKKTSQNMKIKVLAYCILGNHYHLILQNSSGKLSDFMRQLNGQYALYYRMKHGGKGYLFQDRYKSTLIQEDNYLKVAIIYVLLNPVRAGLVKDPYEYKWSSIAEYFMDASSWIVDSNFVEEVLEDEKNMRMLLSQWLGKDIPIKSTRFGNILGDQWFIDQAVKRFNRRKKSSESRRMRKVDYIFEPAEEVIKRFEKVNSVRIDDIDVNRIIGKKLRTELLIMLKDRAGLRYREIIRYSPFQTLKYSSLGQLYKRAKKEIIKTNKEST